MVSLPRVLTDNRDLNRWLQTVARELDGLGARVGTGGAATTIVQQGGALPAAGGTVPTLDTPPMPVGLWAIGGLGLIGLTWSNPFRIYANHARTRVYRATVDQFDMSIEIGQAAYLSYLDTDAADDTDYWYWIRWESAQAVLGPPSDSVSARTAVDPERVYDNIEQWLGGSPLLAALRSDIANPTFVTEETRFIAGMISILSASAADAADRVAKAARDAATAAQTTANTARASATSATATANTARMRATDALNRALSLLNDIGNLARADRLVLNLTGQGDRRRFRAAAVAGASLAIGADAADTTGDTSLTVYEQTTDGQKTTVLLETGIDWSMGPLYVRVSGNRGQDIELTAANRETDPDEIDNNLEWLVTEDVARQTLVARLDRVDTDIDGKASLTALTALTQRVTTAEGEIDVEQGKVTQLQTDVAGKAETSALTALTGRVTAAEGGVTANSASITALEARLVSTSLGPAQNEFTGTDRAAAEAARDAYAAANATWLAAYQADDDLNIRLTWGMGTLRVFQHLVNTAAEGETPAYEWQDNGEVEPTAAAITTLSASVTQNDADIQANADAITSLESEVDDKADASALTALTTRVTTAEGEVDANAESITALETTVGTKADASDLAAKADATALTALRQLVTANQTDIGVNQENLALLEAALDGLLLGPVQNTFAGADRTAAETARDAYTSDTDNANWLAEYDGDATLHIRLLWGTTVQYQNRASDAWADVNADPRAAVSALDSLTTRMTATEEATSANATAITGLNTALGDKADASAVEALETEIEENAAGVLANANAIRAIQITAGGFRRGPAQNEFTGANRMAAEAARDAFASANMGWLPQYQAESDFYILLTFD